MYVHADIYFYEKSQNLTPPTHTLHSLTLNGHCYGNNSLTQNLERHLAQIMKEEMRQWVKPCMVWWPTVAPLTDCFRTPWGPCHLQSVTFCPAQCRKQLSLALALSLFFPVLTVNGLSAILLATELSLQSTQPGPQYLCWNNSWPGSERGEFPANEGKQRHRPYLEYLEQCWCSVSAYLAADEGPAELWDKA